jgi:DNA anti-recombination protein RmuC
MSNMQNFKTEMGKLKHTLSGTQTDLKDPGSSTSTFYTKLVDLFQKLKNDATFKNCIYNFGNTSVSSGVYSIYISSKDQNCLDKLTNSNIFTSSGLKKGVDGKNQTYLSYTTTQSSTNQQSSSNPDQLSAEDIRRNQIRDALYGSLDPVFDKISSQGQTVQTALGTMTENLNEDINRIKKMMYG